MTATEKSLRRFKESKRISKKQRENMFKKTNDLNNLYVGMKIPNFDLFFSLFCVNLNIQMCILFCITFDV